MDNPATAPWVNDKDDRDHDNDHDSGSRTISINHRLSDPILREELDSSSGTAVSLCSRGTRVGGGKRGRAAHAHDSPWD